MLSWDDAQAFCAWLTKRERELGLIPAELEYRLPTDHEWSCAAGIGEQENADQPPAIKGKGPWNWYPWGESWPPPKGVANYAGEEAAELMRKPAYDNLEWVITGYRDPFVFTAPVGSFPGNADGLHDLSGNLWEWCEDWLDQQNQLRVLRGHSFLCNTGAGAKLSARGSAPQSARQPIFGVRVVLAPARQVAGKVPYAKE
jgi:formylglycine-generating enzyme required for sulfatase activity